MKDLKHFSQLEIDMVIDNQVKWELFKDEVYDMNYSDVIAVLDRLRERLEL